MSRIRVNQEYVSHVEVVKNQEQKMVFSYNYRPEGGLSELEVSRNKYRDNHNDDIFYLSGFSSGNVDTALTLEEVEHLISTFQRMVDQVKK